MLLREHPPNGGCFECMGNVGRTPSVVEREGEDEEVKNWTLTISFLPMRVFQALALGENTVQKNCAGGRVEDTMGKIVHCHHTADVLEHVPPVLAGMGSRALMMPGSDRILMTTPWIRGENGSPHGAEL